MKYPPRNRSSSTKVGGTDCIAIIPARGGSKGVPRKNLQLLAGTPLVGHAIAKARAAVGIGRVFVSTEDNEIASVSRRHGAEIIRRPNELAADTTSSEDVLLHALEYLRTTEDLAPTVFVFLQCTSPLILPEDIAGVLQALLSADADSALSVCSVHSFLWKQTPSGEAEAINHNAARRLRRQDLDPQYVETGAVYAIRTKAFLQKRSRFCGKTVMHIVPEERGIDIDTPQDLSIAEMLMRKQQSELPLSLLPDKIEALVLDFDGVLTDNRVIVGEDGTESVVCSKEDSLALSRIASLNLPIAVISGERNSVVSARCKKLGIECLQGVHEKLPALEAWASKKRVSLSGTIFVGNDLNDLECVKAVGCGVSVGDAANELKRASKLVLSCGGGKGAIRELIELLIRASERATPERKSSMKLAG